MIIKKECNLLNISAMNVLFGKEKWKEKNCVSISENNTTDALAFTVSYNFSDQHSRWIDTGTNWFTEKWPIMTANK